MGTTTHTNGKSNGATRVKESVERVKASGATAAELVAMADDLAREREKTARLEKENAELKARASTTGRRVRIERVPGTGGMNIMNEPFIADAALGFTYNPSNRCKADVDVSKLPVEAILYEATGWNGEGDAVENLLATSVRMLRMLNAHIAHDDSDSESVEASILDVQFKLCATAELHRRIVSGLTTGLAATLERASYRVVVEEGGAT